VSSNFLKSSLLGGSLLLFVPLQGIASPEDDSLGHRAVVRSRKPVGAVAAAAAAPAPEELGIVERMFKGTMTNEQVEIAIRRVDENIGKLGLKKKYPLGMFDSEFWEQELDEFEKKVDDDRLKTAVRGIMGGLLEALTKNINCLGGEPIDLDDWTLFLSSNAEDIQREWKKGPGKQGQRKVVAVLDWLFRLNAPIGCSSRGEGLYRTGIDYWNILMAAMNEADKCDHPNFFFENPYEKPGNLSKLGEVRRSLSFWFSEIVPREELRDGHSYFNGYKMFTQETVPLYVRILAEIKSLRARPMTLSMAMQIRDISWRYLRPTLFEQWMEWLLPLMRTHNYLTDGRWISLLSRADQYLRANKPSTPQDFWLAMNPSYGGLVPLSSDQSLGAARALGGAAAAALEDLPETSERPLGLAGNPYSGKILSKDSQGALVGLIRNDTSGENLASYGFIHPDKTRGLETGQWVTFRRISDSFYRCTQFGGVLFEDEEYPFTIPSATKFEGQD